MRNRLSVLTLALLVGCGSQIELRTIQAEGDDPGECSDGADNDGDGAFDCQDEDCLGSAECCDDPDGDGICAEDDLCPAGDDTQDADGDGTPNACDPCPADVADDSDNDGVCDSQDRCAGHSDYVDRDGDQVPDGCDPCPDDALDDSDGDGVCDRFDRCPAADDTLDADGDQVPDACDECPFDHPDDSDDDGVCDSDDQCVGADDGEDADGDGVPDACDPCPLDALDDSDGDGSCDTDDTCLGADDSLDLDGDDIPDACDEDQDGDGWLDGDDCAPRDAAIHPLAGDVYGDGLDPDCDHVDCDATWSGGAYLVTCAGTLDQAAADAQCQTQGYDGLASVLSEAEQTLLEGQGAPTWDRWIGGTDAATPYVWTWGPGYHFRFANWAAGEPDNSAMVPAGDCAVLLSQNDAFSPGAWSTAACANALVTQGYTCELRCADEGDVDGDGRCDPDDSCFGENQAGDLDLDGICDDVDSLDSQLVLAMPMEGSMADVSASAAMPTPGVGVIYTPTPWGTGVHLTDTTSTIATGVTDAAIGYTFAFWYLSEQNGTTTNYDFMVKGDDLSVFYSDNGQYGFNVERSGAFTISTPDPRIDGGWHHLAVVADGAFWHIYQDGVPISSDGPDASPPMFDELVLGSPNANAFFHAYPQPMDDIRFYLRALSPFEIAVLAGGAQ